MEVVADLHLHSKYSRAVSQDMILPTMAAWAKKKGIDILTTGDWTHPLWFREIKSQLEEANDGVYRLKSEIRSTKSEANSNDQNANDKKEPLFLLTVEVASIYSQGGKVRRIHNLIFAPSFDVAEKINRELHKRGVNLLSDGRPMMGISSRDLLELVLGIDKNAILVPCHAWTPWFSLYGSNSGFDCLEECFGEYAKFIYAVESGLSSDPEMNWRIKELENRSILSFSDAHSPAKMGREATVFETGDESGVISYETIRRAITMNHEPKTHNFPRIAYTIEFYPEEGKYHYTGHRNCKVVQTPQETKENSATCPVCGRKLTIGVMHRVEELSQKTQNTQQFRKSEMSDGQKVRNTGLSEFSEYSGKKVVDKYGVRWIHDPTGNHPPFVKLVPLLEILAEALDSTTTAVRVKQTFDRLVESFNGELAVLLRTSAEDIGKLSGKKSAEAIKKVRGGDIVVEPGYDGEYGKVKIWPESENVSKDFNNEENQNKQLGLF